MDVTIEDDNEFCGNGNNDVVVSSIFFVNGMCPDLLPVANPPLVHFTGAAWALTLGPDVGWDYIVAAGNPGIVVNGEPVNGDLDPDHDKQPLVSAVTPWLVESYCNPSAPMPVYSCPE